MTGKQRTHEQHSGRAHEMAAKEKFIIDLYPVALAESKQTGLSWELILAQTAQETDWGQKVLPGTHNLYNINGWLLVTAPVMSGPLISTSDSPGPP